MRVARTVTGRNKIAIFANDYHGMFDEVLVRSSTMGGKSRTVPVSPGIRPKGGEYAGAGVWQSSVAGGSH